MGGLATAPMLFKATYPPPNKAPTLVASRTALPPEGAAAPAARQSRFRGPGWPEVGAHTPVTNMKLALVFHG